MAAFKELVHNAFDNSIELLLLLDGAPVDLSNITRVTITLGATTVDSNVTPAAFDYTPIRTGTATSGSASTLRDTGLSLRKNELRGFLLKITGGTGSGQSRVVKGNTADTFTVKQPWAVTPDNTSAYALEGRLKLKLGGQGIAVGTHTAKLVLYDAINTSGIVWASSSTPAKLVIEVV